MGMLDVSALGCTLTWGLFQVGPVVGMNDLRQGPG